MFSLFLYFLVLLFMQVEECNLDWRAPMHPNLFICFIVVLGRLISSNSCLDRLLVVESGEDFFALFAFKHFFASWVGLEHRDRGFIRFLYAALLFQIFHFEILVLIIDEGV